MAARATFIASGKDHSVNTGEYGLQAKVERSTLIALVLLCLPPAAAFGQEVPLPFESELGRKYRAALEFVLVPPDQLPQGCGLAREAGSAPIYPFFTNPQALEEPWAVEFLAAILGIRKLFDSSRVSAAITALYHDRVPSYEIGIAALRFKNADGAAKTYQKAGATNRPPEARLVLKGPMILSVWRDAGARDDCYNAIRAHVDSKDFSSDPAER